MIEVKGERMMNHYQFFQNKKCEFFPCHQVKQLETFNCLFCYCPLYALKEKCGGHYVILENGIKDCSHCLIVHHPAGYEHVMSKMPLLMDEVKLTPQKNKKEEIK